jgi:hypothetical protein
MIVRVKRRALEINVRIHAHFEVPAEKMPFARLFFIDRDAHVPTAILDVRILNANLNLNAMNHHLFREYQIQRFHARHTTIAMKV